MSISRITIYAYNIPLKAPITISLGTIDHARNVLIQMETTHGLTGWGEGSPLWMIVGETQASALAVAPDLARLLLGLDPADLEAATVRMNAFLPHNPTVKSAFDMALYDLAAQQAGMPLYQFLGGSNRPLITDETIYLNTPERMAEDAVRIKANGAEAIKVKLGLNPADDIARVRAIRQAIGPDLPLRVDANQGWDYVSARQVLTAIGDLNVQYCEQPVPRHQYADLARLRQSTTIPIMADESLFDPADALRLVREEAVDYFNIKLSKSGGIYNALKINAIAEAAGISCMIGCMSESRLAITANAHLAAARYNIRFCDLDGHFEHALDPVVGGVRYTNYRITLPDGPGLGASPNPAFLAGLQSVVV